MTHRTIGTLSGLLMALIVCVLAPSVAWAHRPTDPPHQLYQMGDLALESGQVRDVRTVTISPSSVTGHAAAGGFLPADVDLMNVEIGQFLDLVTQRGEKLR